MSGIKFKLLLLLPLVVCTGFPLHVPPIVARLNALMKDIGSFFSHTASTNYDAYFFTPALMALDDIELQNNTFLDFFARDFCLKDHAKHFRFNEMETKSEFAKRFFRYISKIKSVPKETRKLAAKFATSFTPRAQEVQVNGFLKPCPLYAFVRAITLISEIDRQLRGIDLNSLNVVLKFILTKFRPDDFGIENDAYVQEVPVTLFYGFEEFDYPLRLLDGSFANQRNKEVLKRIAADTNLPQFVKDAITEVASRL